MFVQRGEVFKKDSSPIVVRLDSRKGRAVPQHKLCAAFITEEGNAYYIAEDTTLKYERGLDELIQ